MLSILTCSAYTHAQHVHRCVRIDRVPVLYPQLQGLLLQHWEDMCSDNIRKPSVCLLWSLHIGLSLTSIQVTHISHISMTPPCASANTFFAQFTVSSIGSWLCRQSCQSSTKLNAGHAVFMSYLPSYQHALLKGSPVQQQLLLVLHCRLLIANQYHGFTLGQCISPLHHLDHIH